MELKGLYTAIVTPFKNGNVDYEKFEELIEQQIQQCFIPVWESQ